MASIYAYVVEIKNPYTGEIVEEHGPIRDWREARRTIFKVRKRLRAWGKGNFSSRINTKEIQING
jgi:hypothetical protein